MRVRLLKVKHWLLLALLSWMGVASCSKDMYDCPEDEFHVMYGVPQKEYNDTLPNE